MQRTNEHPFARGMLMYPSKPLPHAEQIDRMKRYLRRLHSELRYRYDEFSRRPRDDVIAPSSRTSATDCSTREAVALQKPMLRSCSRLIKELARETLHVILSSPRSIIKPSSPGRVAESMSCGQ